MVNGSLKPGIHHYFCKMKAANRFIIVFIGIVLLAGVYAAGISSSGLTTAPSKDILLRKIGHQLLLNAGDDSSRVLPIKKLSASEYEIRFEHDLALTHNSIIKTVRSMLDSMKLAYRVDVYDCSFKDAVYSFEIKANGQEFVPCAGRSLPRSCYFINVNFEEQSSVQWLWYCGALAVLFGAAVYAGLFLKKKKQAAPVKEDAGIIQPAGISIGRYKFYPETHCLELNGSKILLTNKESTLLAVFAASPNEVIPRQLLQKEGWEKDGIIVTRSLDMFISKLRKKLQDDPSVRIVSFTGRGYMLEITG